MFKQLLRAYYIIVFYKKLHCYNFILTIDIDHSLFTKHNMIGVIKPIPHSSVLCTKVYYGYFPLVAYLFF